MSSFVIVVIYDGEVFVFVFVDLNVCVWYDDGFVSFGGRFRARPTSAPKRRSRCRAPGALLGK